MNFEDFSSEEQKVIGDFRNLIENIKSGKDKSKIFYFRGGGKLLPYVTDCTVATANNSIDSIIHCFCIVGRVPYLRFMKIFSFLKDKNYFLPEFSSYEELQQNKNKYHFIAQ